MTTGIFERVMIDAITIERSTRQRKELVKIDELAASIAAVGLINVPVVTRQLELVAGERRLEACRSLGWLEIPVQFTDTMDQTELQLLELEENVKRVDLSWQDQNDAIAAYHRLRLAAAPDWKQEDTAEALGVSKTWVNKNLTVAQARSTGVKDVSEAAQFSIALGLASRNKERARSQAERDLPEPEVFAPKTSAPLPSVKVETPIIPESRIELINNSFLEWVKNPPRRFNLVHCDFPYGVNVGDKSGQSAASVTGSYSDTPEIYFELLNAFTTNTDKFVEPSAHLMFWFSMKYYRETKTLLEDGGWRVDPFPLIWYKSDNAGILPDKDRGPRRVYETAFLASRGDRKIVRPVANTFSGPTTRELHTSEKPRPMLDHFFRMLVDESTTLLDPTAGSANSIRVSHARGAAYSLGIELDTEFYLKAKEHLSK